ncbi:MAG TPA: hypothetical protein V6C96_04855 [Vampirovibrionales bacterium]
MQLDPWSIVLGVTLSVFCFLAFILSNRKRELKQAQTQLIPASKEAIDIITKNFLSFSEIPSKTKLISIMKSLARKHKIQISNHFSMHNLIDSLVYQVVSNDLLDPYKKKELTDKLLKLKTEPINTEEYLSLSAENEEARSLTQRNNYSQLAQTLIVSSLILGGLGISSFQLHETYSIPSQVLFTVDWLLIVTIGFSVLVAGYTIVNIVSSGKPKNKSTQKQLADAKLATNKAISSPVHNKKLVKPTAPPVTGLSASRPNNNVSMNSNDGQKKVLMMHPLQSLTGSTSDKPGSEKDSNKQGVIQKSASNPPLVDADKIHSVTVKKLNFSSEEKKNENTLASDKETTESQQQPEEELVTAAPKAKTRKVSRKASSTKKSAKKS